MSFHLVQYWTSPKTIAAAPTARGKVVAEVPVDELEPIGMNTPGVASWAGTATPAKVASTRRDLQAIVDEAQVALAALPE